MRSTVLAFAGMCCLSCMLLDMFASIFGLIALAKADYWVARVIVGGLGIIMTLGVAMTKYVLDGRARFLLIVLWMICLASDLATNAVSFSHFLMAQGTVDTAIKISPAELLEMWKADPVPGVIAVVGMLVVSIGTAGSLYCIDTKEPTLQRRL